MSSSQELLGARTPAQQPMSRSQEYLLDEAGPRNPRDPPGSSATARSSGPVYSRCLASPKQVLGCQGQPLHAPRHPRNPGQLPQALGALMAQHQPQPR